MLPEWYNNYKTVIEKYLENYLQEYFSEYIENPWLKQVIDGVFYSVKWWKRIRAILALEFYFLLSWKTINDIWNQDDILKFCIALEIIHAYSLLHDDLPCMDNDEYRRGELTVWKKYGEANGVLIGDLLNTLSFEIVSDIKDSIISQKLTKLLSHSVWFHGMLWWQVDDLYFEKNFEKLNIESLTNLHNKKTGALIKASILWWIILAWAEEKIQEFWDFWSKIGLAFQIKDDLLDVEGTFEETGKSVWWEEKGFVYFLWVEKSREKLAELIRECLGDIMALKSYKLEFLVNYIGNRKK